MRPVDRGFMLTTVMYLPCNPIDTQFDHVFARWIDDGLSGTILWVNYTEREKGKPYNLSKQVNEV